VKGNMSVCNRKGKTIYIYDVQIKLEWEGDIKNKPTVPDEKEDTKPYSAKGTIYIEDIATDEDKWKMTVKIENETALNVVIKKELLNNVRPVIDNVVKEILEAMKGNSAIKEEIGFAIPITEAKPVKTNTRITPLPEQSGTFLSTGGRAFVQKVSFDVSPQPLYEAFITEDRVRAYTGSDSIVESRVGGQFTMFGGTLHGEHVCHML